MNEIDKLTQKLKELRQEANIQLPPRGPEPDYIPKTKVLQVPEGYTGEKLRRWYESQSARTPKQSN